MRNLMFCFAVLLIAAVTSSAQKSPVIVKQIALTNQTEFIKATKLITPTSDALYRISAYLEVTELGQTGDQYYLNFGWTDSTGKVTRNKVVKIDDIAQGPLPLSSSATLIVSDLASQPVFVSVSNLENGVPPEVPYNVFITVEQLQ